MKNRDYRKFARELDGNISSSHSNFMKDTDRVIKNGYIRFAGCVLAAASPFIIIAWIFFAIYFYLSDISVPFFVYAIIALMIVLCTFILVFEEKEKAVRLPGVLLKRKDAPELFRLVDKVRKKLDAPSFYQIHLTNDYNASVFTEDRYTGKIHGLQRHHLILGLTLLMLHDEKQLSGIIAHEYAHIIGKHSITTKRVGFMKNRFINLFVELKKVPLLKYAFKQLEKILSSYFDYLAARISVLRRYHEFEADKIGSSIQGPEGYAQSLYRIEFMSLAIQRTFWSGIWRTPLDEEVPPKNVFQSLELHVRQQPEEDETALIHHHLQSRKTVFWQSHPCLRERISALTQKPLEAFQTPEPLPYDESAAKKLLGKERFEHYRTLFSNLWKSAVIQEWRECHEFEKQNTKQLQEMDEESKERELTINEKWLQIYRTFNRIHRNEKIQKMQGFLRENPNHPECSYFLGSIWLGLGKHEDALPLLRVAAEKNTLCRLEGLQGLYDYFESQGMHQEVDEIEGELEKYQKEREKTRYERSKVFMDDKFENPDLDPNKIKGMARFLKYEKPVSRAWLVTKKVKHLQELPCYILLVKFEKDDRSAANQKSIQRILNSFNISLIVAPWHETFETPRNGILETADQAVFDRSD